MDGVLVNTQAISGKERGRATTADGGATTGTTTRTLTGRRKSIGKAGDQRPAQATHKTQERELEKQHPRGGRTQQLRRELEAKQHHARRQDG